MHPDSSEPQTSDDERRKKLLRYGLIGGAAVLIVGLAVALIVVLAGGSDEAPATASARAATSRAQGPDGEYVAQVRPHVKRLSESARVTGKALAVASKPRDVQRVSRTARQQMALVQQVRGRLADVPAGRTSRKARGELARATQAHRQYLGTLSRIAQTPTPRALKAVPRAQRQARKALTHYRAFSTQIPGMIGGITTAELADMSGLRAALVAKRAKEEQEAKKAEEAARPAAPPSGGGGGGGDATRNGPVVEGVSGRDAGSTIEISARYCDRTPGTVNTFEYSFSIRDSSGANVASDYYSANQTRACNDISWSFPDTFAFGSYTATVQVNNITNGVSGGNSGYFSVIN